MKIRLLPAAERDLQIGADCYNSQSAVLGRYFNECLMSYVDSLRLYAGIHGKQHGLYRCMSKRFSFAIYYDAAPDWTVGRIPQRTRPG